MEGILRQPSFPEAWNSHKERWTMQRILENEEESDESPRQCYDGIHPIDSSKGLRQKWSQGGRDKGMGELFKPASSRPVADRTIQRPGDREASESSSEESESSTVEQEPGQCGGQEEEERALGGGDGVVNARPRGGNGKANKNDFLERLNTLKMLLECGHLSEEDYRERSSQIINALTGTSARAPQPKKRKSRRLQPILQTVVAHGPPNFDTIAMERAEKLTFDVQTLEWVSCQIYVRIDHVPFASGQLRNAYYLREYGQDGHSPSELLVAKTSIHAADAASYLSDVEMQACCSHYAELYNHHDPPRKVHYARSWLLKFKGRNSMVAGVEEYIHGKYVKYSNNNGFVGTETSTNEERERNTPQAFSHFSFVASDYRLMIVDVQGVDDKYTDPQIHTPDGYGFGSGNLGIFGIEQFLKTHRCNHICRWLGLRSLHNRVKEGGTAAPHYRMPHKEIKKSTNKISSTVNSYSRSLTIQEVLGDTLPRTKQRTQVGEARRWAYKEALERPWYYRYLRMICCMSDD